MTLSSPEANGNKMKVFLALSLSFCARLSTVTTVSVDSPEIDVFGPLDDFSFLGVLDFLSYGDLVTLASMSPRNHALIMDHYLRPEIGAYNTTLRIHVTEKPSHDLAYYFRAGEDFKFKLLGTGQECIFATLKVLCPISSGLEVILAYSQYFDEALTQKIAKYVASYCADATQTVTMLGMSDSVKKFQFPLVKRVSIENPEHFWHLDLAYSFPHVERLSIDISDHFTIAQHLPNLTHFQLHDKTCGNFDLPEFGKRNPQIRSIELELCGQIENIDEVNELFPGLESLHLKLKRERLSTKEGDRKGSKMATEMVRFRNVTKFTLDLTYFYGRIYGFDKYIPLTSDNLEKDRLTVIGFDRLESFTFVSNVDMNHDDQIDFVARFKDVMTLDFSGVILQYDEIKRLVDALPKLKEIAWFCSTTGLDDLGRLMQEMNLDAIRVVVGGWYQGEFRAQVVLPDEWILYADQDFLYQSVFTYKRNGK